MLCIFTLLLTACAETKPATIVPLTRPAVPAAYASKNANPLAGNADAIAKGKAEFINFSFDVKVEGKNVPRALDLMLHNDKNTPPMPVIQPPLIALPLMTSETSEEKKEADIGLFDRKK